MNFKLSQTTKDFFDIIRAVSSYISIAAFGLGLILYTVDKNIVINFFKDHKIIAYSLGGIVVLLPIVMPLIYTWINQINLRRRKLSNVVIEKQEAIIDITDNGKLASYYERMCFYRIGKNNHHYLAKMRVSGKIDPSQIHTLNCFYQLNNEKNRLTISYVNSTKKISGLGGLIPASEKFLAYSAVVTDTFIADEESWDLEPENYCVSYKLTIILPEGKTLAYATLYRQIDSKLIEESNFAPIIVTENKRVKILLQIADYDYGDHLILKWKLA